ncbi:hypothetical protein HY750_01990 [Candidatus Kuenenbacteria bacterium]|nr:hypothetical protein [Candidatus Kuenenbacteria bacterium]
MAAGLIYIAANSPYFVLNLMKNFKKWRKYKRRKLSTTFWRLQKQGCLEIKNQNHQIYICLTEKGKKIAGWLQINALKIKKPKKWDKKWRIVIFDISQLKKTFREAFRGKLKELGFIQLQKSVWIYPFDCQGEIELLRDFFGLNQKELKLIIAQNIGDDDWLRKIFKI